MNSTIQNFTSQLLNLLPTTQTHTAEFREAIYSIISNATSQEQKELLSILEETIKNAILNSNDPHQVIEINMEKYWVEDLIDPDTLEISQHFRTTRSACYKNYPKPIIWHYMMILSLIK